MKFGFIRRHRRWSAAVVVVALPVMSVAAFMIATGSGNGTATGVAGSPAAQVFTIVQTAPIAGDYVPAAYLPGGVQTIHVKVTNPGPDSAVLNSVSFNPTGWTSSASGCTNAAMVGSFSATGNAGVSANFVTPVGGPLTLASGATSASLDLVITWANLAVDQTPCAGGTFTYALHAS